MPDTFLKQRIVQQIAMGYCIAYIQDPKHDVDEDTWCQLLDKLDDIIADDNSDDEEGPRLPRPDAKAYVNSRGIISINGKRRQCEPAVFWRRRHDEHSPRPNQTGYFALKTNHFEYELDARYGAVLLAGRGYVTRLTCDYGVRGIKKWMDAITDLYNDSFSLEEAKRAATVLLLSHDASSWQSSWTGASSDFEASQGEIIAWVGYILSLAENDLWRRPWKRLRDIKNADQVWLVGRLLELLKNV